MMRRPRNGTALGALPQTILALMNVRLIIMLVFTGLTSMIVAENRLPAIDVLAFTVLGAVLSAAGASVISQSLNSTLTAKIAGTSRHSIASGQLTAGNAMIFGMALLAWSVLILGVWVNWLATGLALSGALVYPLVYALVRKRNTAFSILIVAGACATPTLAGWAAAKEVLAPQAFILFAIAFYWTLSHSWALAFMANRDDAAAEFPMMPVAGNDKVSRYRILFYSIQLFLISLSPGLLLLLPIATPLLGWVYLLFAIALGLHLIWQALQLNRKANEATALALYKYSSIHLALLCSAMIADRLLL